MQILNLLILVTMSAILTNGQTLCGPYKGTSCQAYTQSIVASVEGGYCNGNAEAACMIFEQEIHGCMSRFAYSMADIKRKCFDYPAMVRCMSSSYTNLFTSAKVNLSCRNGSGEVIASAIGYACIFAQDFSELIGDNSDYEIDQVAETLVTSFSDARCALSATGYGHCVAVSRARTSFADASLTDNVKHKFGCP